ncbi:MAG: AAA family ATPase [Nitrososphaerales archaeon]|jgi:hypothetical protein
MPRNPFTPGSGTYPPFLAGRGSQLIEFNKILESLKAGHLENVLVYGLRGVGKTVLLDDFQRACVDQGFLTIRRSHFSRKYSDSLEFDMAFRYDIRTAIETFSHFSKVRNKAKSAISLIKPKSVGVGDLFYYEPSYDKKRDAPFEDHLTDLLKKNWSIFEKAGYAGVIFLYDEFHTVVDNRSEGQYVLSDFIAAMNESQKDGARFFPVLCGLPNLRLNLKKARSYSERMFTDILLTHLDATASREAIEKPLDGSGYAFSSELISALTKDTGGYPFFLQFYGKQLISNAGKQRIEMSDYERVKSVITKELDVSFFDQRFDSASTDEQEVLCGMSRFLKEDIPSDFIVKTTGMSRTNVSRSLSRLGTKGIVYNFKRGFYRFSLPMFREYLVRRCR